MRAERALTRPWVELQAAKLQNVPQSPNGTVLISGVSRESRVWPIGMLLRAATLWLGISPSWYPGPRRCSLRSHRLALGSDRTVPSGLRVFDRRPRSVPLGSSFDRRTSAASGPLATASKNQMRLCTPRLTRLTSEHN